MRRLALIFGMFLTLTAGVWSSALAAASDWCMHERRAPVASDEHDCCRAKIGDPDTHHSGSQETSHENSTARTSPDESHAGMNCGGADVSSTPETGVVAMGERGGSCAECCAGGSGQTPATAAVVAPEQNKVRRDAGSDSASARGLFALAPSHVLHLAPSQHAPPATPQRRHVLIGVFLI